MAVLAAGDRQGPVPSTVEPFLKVTLPVGVPPPVRTGATMAVNVTDWPATAGLAEDLTIVPVVALVITKVVELLAEA